MKKIALGINVYADDWTAERRIAASNDYIKKFFLKTNIFSFKQSIEENVDLRYVTHRFLKTSDNKDNPISGQMKFSLEVLDKQWQPRLGRKKWDPTNRTFTEVNIESQSYFVLLIQLSSSSCFSLEFEFENTACS